MSVSQDVRGAISGPRGDRHAALIGVAIIAVFWGFTGVLIALNDGNPNTVLIAGLIVAGYSLPSAIAAFATFRARRTTAGLERRTWRNLTIGLVLWTSGGVSYIVSLASGGELLEPTAWSQAGYLAAYPFWYLALWQLRQPVLAPSRARQIETVLIEVAALLMLGLVVASILWTPNWPVSHNVAQLVPPILDMLLLATFYAAVRRSQLSANTALTWLGYAFSVLALSDILLTYLVARGQIIAGGAVSAGYVVAMMLIVVASRRPLRVAEAQNRLRGTLGIVAVGGLALAGLAVQVAPGPVQPIALLAGGLLAWRAISILNERESSDTDLLTGFLKSHAFERHLGGVIQLSTDDRPSLLIVVDLDGFGAWNARNGYNTGDAMLARVAASLEGSGPPAAAWGRLKADRFALTTISQGIEADRELAEHLRSAAAGAAEPLSARAGLVLVPRDARGSAEALDASDEALRAGSEAKRAVVAYAGGELDGINPTPGSASLAVRRRRIQDLIADEDSLNIFLQPVVRLEDLTIKGFEALSRFTTEPPLGPDQWIAEATVLGFGVDLEIHCARRAWEREPEIPAQATLSINVSPEAIASDLFMQVFGGHNLEGLVFEVTEHERVTNYARLAARLAAVRGRGAKVAIDDTGAGHASLNHLIELKPDYIKLDRKLVTGLDLDAGKHALVRNMLRLADDLGAELVAEGIETKGELWALRELGVPLGQGYHLGRPTLDPDRHIARFGVAARPVRSPRQPSMA